MCALSLCCCAVRELSCVAVSLTTHRLLVTYSFLRLIIDILFFCVPISIPPIRTWTDAVCPYGSRSQLAKCVWSTFAAARIEIFHPQWCSSSWVAVCCSTVAHCLILMLLKSVFGHLIVCLCVCFFLCYVVLLVSSLILLSSRLNSIHLLRCLLICCLLYWTLTAALNKLTGSL